MQGHTPHQPNQLLISEQRCSEELRSLAIRYGWPVLEGIDTTPAIHACVALEPTSVCVEYTKPLRTVPELLRRLSALHSIDRVACLIPDISPILEQSLASIGTQAFTSTDCVVKWLCSNSHDAKSGSSAGISDSMAFQRTTPRGIRVNRKLHIAPKGAKK